MNGAQAVSLRILMTLRGDKRTLGLILVVPVVLIYLLSEVFERPTEVAPVLLAVFVFMLTYILTAIGFLRERQAGTFERVLVSPISRLELVLGYVLGYGLLATALSLVLLGASVHFFELEFEHGVVLFFLVEWLGALSALAIGILLSLFAQNEFQVMQFIPIVISPQIILGGTFMPVEDLPFALEVLARIMPLTYLIQGMNYVVLDEGSASDFWIAVVALLFFADLSAIAANETLRRVR